MPGEIQLLDRGFNVLATPNPEEWAFAVVLAAIDLRPKMMVPLGTKYRKATKLMPLLDKQRVSEGWGDYVYTGSSNDIAPPGHIALYFAKGKTAEEAAVPFRKYTMKFGNHYWHPILVDVVVVADTGRVIAMPGPNGTTRYEYPHVMRKIYQPPVSEGTRFVMEEGTSPVPMVIPRHRVPIPGNVSFDFGDVRGDFPECLHGDLEIGPQQTVFAIDNAAKESSSSYAAIAGQNFPATNVTTRRPYVLVHEQEYRNGVWYWWKIRVYPPRGSGADELVVE